MSTADDLLQDMRDVLIGIATNRQSPTVVESAASQAAARIDAYLTRTHDRGADVLAVIERLETGLAGYNVAANPYGATIYLLSAVRDALPMLRALSAQHPAPSTALRERWLCCGTWNTTALAKSRIATTRSASRISNC